MLVMYYKFSYIPLINNEPIIYQDRIFIGIMFQVNNDGDIMKFYFTSVIYGINHKRHYANDK